MKIGELAKTIGCQTVTVRFYESKGLLGHPARTPGNYRNYNKEDLERLAFIRNCRALGLTIEEITRLIELQENPELLCNDVNQLIEDHLMDVERQMEALRQLQGQLRTLRHRCDSTRTSNQCGVLQALAVERFKTATADN